LMSSSLEWTTRTPSNFHFVSAMTQLCSGQNDKDTMSLHLCRKALSPAEIVVGAIASQIEEWSDSAWPLLEDGD
jgi:hypothetical protein